MSHPPPIPADDDARVASVHRLSLANSDTEDVFQHFVELASAACGTPVALMTVLDEENQWHKARVGEQLLSIARSESFCTHVVASGEPLIVPDAETDPRFSTNPHVTKEGGIRMYAGFPFGIAGASPVGALCVIDQRARTLTPEELATLRRLADGLSAEIEVRNRLHLLTEHTKQTKWPLRSASAWTVLRHRFSATPGTAYVSDNIEARTGYPPEAFYEDPELGLRIVHPDDRRALTSAIEGGLTYDSEINIRWVHRHGEVVPMELRGRTITNELGELVGFEAVARTVAPEIPTREEIQGTLEELEHNPTSMLFVNGDLNLTHISSDAPAVLGLAPTSAQWLECANPEDRAAIADAIRGVHIGLTPCAHFWFRTATTPPRIIAATARAGVPGVGAEVVVTIHDDTPRVQDHLVARRNRRESAKLATKRAAAIDRLNRVQRRKAELVAMLVHDLKGPLSVVSLGVEEILDLSEEREISEVASDIGHAADQMRRLVLDILDVQRGTHGEIPVRWAVIRPDILASEIGRTTGVTAALYERSVITKVAPETPTIAGDSGLLERVLNNLITNAIRYCPKEHPVLLEMAPAAAGEQGVQLRIIDKGPGIPDGLKETVFERWHSGDATTAGRESHGLGLMFCRMAVQAMQGSIDVEDTEGGGCTMVIQLTAAESSSSHAQ